MSGISYQGRGKKLRLDGFQDTSLTLREEDKTLQTSIWETQTLRGWKKFD